MQNQPSTPSHASPFASWRGDHTGLRVADFEAAVAWYTGTLDFRIEHDWAHGDMRFALLAPAADDDFRIELIGGPGATARPPYAHLGDSLGAAGWHHLCFRVDDVDATMATLERRGVRIVSEARDVAAIRRRFAFVADPWGNLIELSQVLAG
jgi:catechol 2,3-dioxygenase-like lactoylglutathione lyase family enzyme